LKASTGATRKHHSGVEETRSSFRSIAILHFDRAKFPGQEALMKAIQFDRLGGPEVMELREVPMPEL
jgi:hypothetical protein